jgi:hypothetical protein
MRSSVSLAIMAPSVPLMLKARLNVCLVHVCLVHGQNCTEVDGCAERPCYLGMVCHDTGFVCESCLIGYEGNGINCTEINGCAKPMLFRSHLLR